MARLAPHSRGFTLVETLGALALAAVVSVGAASMIQSSLEDTRAQHVGRHQATVVEASERYLRENYAALLAATAAAPVAVPIGTLTALLPEGFQSTNAYGQTPCLRVRQPGPGRLDALVIAEGGESIPTKNLAYVAAHAGPGGGQINADAPNVAQGVFGSWRVDVSTYGAAPCGAAPAGAPSNRLASAIFYDGPATTGTDYLYRGEVPGHPELNALSVPLAMRGRAVAVENDSADPMCSLADPASQGRIAVSAAGAVLSCRNGTWRRQGSVFWKDPVASFAALPLVGNNPGDTHIALDTMRGFTWDGTAWRALAVNDAGDMEVPRSLHLVNSVVRNTACTPDGAVSREPSGRLLSCQSGRWQTLGSMEVDPSQSETGGSVILRSNYLAYPPGTNFYSGPFSYDAPNDTVMAQIDRVVMPRRDGLIISNVNADMSVDNYASPTDNGQFTLLVQVVDRDTGGVIAANRAMSSRIVNDRATLAVTLSKAVPRNVNGYTFQMLVLWTRYRGSYAGNFYDRASYLNAVGGVVELTPLELGWSIDLTY